ncbi:MAG: sulfite exporter TauE/SafE family protein [Candidatus Abyssubacteria bacterium]
MAPEFSWGIIAVCSTIVLAAAVVTGFSGFGFALIAVPLLSLFLDVKFGVPLVLLLAFFSVIILTLNKLRFLREPTVLIILVGMILGITGGAHLLANFETSLLKRLLGVVVILFGLHIFIRSRRERDPKHYDAVPSPVRMVTAFVVGVFSGVAGGLFGTSGPPLVVYVDHFAKDKTAFRAQLLVLFLLHDVYRIGIYLRYSLINMEVVRFGLWMLPAVCIGLLAGSRMHFQVDEKTFSRAVAIMLLISGVLLIIKR